MFLWQRFTHQVTREIYGYFQHASIKLLDSTWRLLGVYVRMMVRLFSGCTRRWYSSSTPPTFSDSLAVLVIKPWSQASTLPPPVRTVHVLLVFCPKRVQHYHSSLIFIDVGESSRFLCAFGKYRGDTHNLLRIFTWGSNRHPRFA